MNVIVKRSDINTKLQAFKGLYFVYYIYLNDECIYIGSSKNIYKRFKTHKHNIRFDYINCISFDTEIDCKTFERLEIYRFKPIFNTFDKTSFICPSIKNHSFGISKLIELHKSIIK